MTTEAGQADGHAAAWREAGLEVTEVHETSADGPIASFFDRTKGGADKIPVGEQSRSDGVHEFQCKL